MATVPPWVFDRDLASRAIGFFEELLRHSKGQRFAGKPFILEPWQRDAIAKTFGTVHRKSRLRRYRRVFVYVPRKNGKSTLAAGVALKLAGADDEPGAEVYSAAADRSQAAIVFDEAKNMVVAESILRERFTIYRRSLVVPETLSTYRVLSADAKTKHGFNTHGCVFDELHTQENRELFDVLTTSVGARSQPLIWMMSTAGYDTDTVCYEQLEYARDVASGKIDDPEFLPILYEADPDKDDWKSPELWRRVNPNFGVSLDPEYIEKEYRRALNSPAYENTFKRLHLNMWTQQETRWLSVEVWDRNAAPTRPLQGRRCYVGCDLSRKTDLTALVGVFPDDEGVLDVLAAFWIPRDRIAEKEREDRVPYSKWVAEGLITATPGNVIDYSAVRDRVDEWARLYEIAEFAYDPWSATQLALEIQDRGLTIVEHRQGFKSMSEPSKALESLLLQAKIRHSGNPVLRWMFGNVAIEEDPAGNIKPSKRKARGRIDGIVALIMAIARATLGGSGKSVYEDRGIRTL